LIPLAHRTAATKEVSMPFTSTRRHIYRPDRTPRTVRERKFVLGHAVQLLSGAVESRIKELENERITARFEIVRLLPDNGHAFQYRIKDLNTGRERAVGEDQIASADVGSPD
jgi:hypothetical protein